MISTHQVRYETEKYAIDLATQRSGRILEKALC